MKLVENRKSSVEQTAMVQLRDRTQDRLTILPGTWEGFKLVRQGL